MVYLGIPLHEGHLFGVANKVINLLVCLALLVAIGFDLLHGSSV